MPLSGVCLGKGQKVVKTIARLGKQRNQVLPSVPVESRAVSGLGSWGVQEKFPMGRASQPRHARTPVSLSRSKTKRFKQAKRSEAEPSKAKQAQTPQRCWVPQSPKKRSRGYAKTSRAVSVMETRKRVGKKNPCKASIRQNSLGVIRRRRRLRDRRETDGQRMKFVDSTQARDDDPFPDGRHEHRFTPAPNRGFLPSREMG